MRDARRKELARDSRDDAMRQLSDESTHVLVPGRQPFRLNRRRLVSGVAGLGAASALALVPDLAQAVAISRVTAVINMPDRSAIYMRECPSPSCRFIRTIPHGARIRPTEAQGNWFKLRYGTATGWVNSWNTTLQGTPSQEIYRGNTSRKMMCLCFDAGADLGHTPRILALLKAENILASFGLSGRWVDPNRGYTRRIADEGHHIFNHTYTHGSFTKNRSYGTTAHSPARRVEELQQCENAIINATGRPTRPDWRPPWGDRDQTVLRDAGAFGFSKTLLWGVDTLGAENATVREICDRTLAAAGNGVIVLMHVGFASKDADALPCVISGLRAMGYSFGTIPQLLAP